MNKRDQSAPISPPSYYDDLLSSGSLNRFTNGLSMTGLISNPEVSNQAAKYNLGLARLSLQIFRHRCPVGIAT